MSPFYSIAARMYSTTATRNVAGENAAGVEGAAAGGGGGGGGDCGGSAGGGGRGQGPHRDPRSPRPHRAGQ